MALTLAACSIACTALLGDFDVDPAGANSSGGASGSPGTCAAGQKSCNGACVSKEDPGVGCAAETCAPCASAPNATATCKAGGCSLECNEGLADCDGNASTVCETRIHNDVAHCGACGAACGAANADVALTRCEQGKCVFACKTGYGHCGPSDATGCETALDKDALHCGACGHSCLGGNCIKGKCQPFLLASASNPSGVAVDATHVYFTFPSVPAIQRVQRNGQCTPAAPCPQDFAGSGVSDPLLKIRGPSAIVSDGSNVWWTNQANGNIGKRAVGLPLGPITNFGPAPSTLPGYLALGGGKIWWTSGFANADPSAHVQKANLDGTQIETVASYASPAANFDGVGAVATDATHVYWASENSGVFRAAFNAAPCVEGSTCAQFGSASGPHGIAVDGSFVYWTEPANGSVRRAPKAGGQSTVIASGQDKPTSIAVLGTFVYWGNVGSTGTTGGSIRRTPQVAAQCVADACELVAPVVAPEGLVAADDGIYWTNRVTNGGVYRLAR